MVHNCDAVLSRWLIQPMCLLLVLSRFSPVDARCDMPLDSVDPEAWAKLELAASEYIQKEALRLDEAAEILSNDWGCQQSADTGSDTGAVGLGSRRKMVVIESPGPFEASWVGEVTKLCRTFRQWQQTLSLACTCKDPSDCLGDSKTEPEGSQSASPLREPSLRDWATESVKPHSSAPEQDDQPGECQQCAAVRKVDNVVEQADVCDNKLGTGGLHVETWGVEGATNSSTADGLTKAPEGCVDLLTGVTPGCLVSWH